MLARADDRGRPVMNLAAQLAALETMTVNELREEYRRLFGVPTRTRNRVHLKKRLAWRIQELAEGGLSARARDRIQALAPDAPARWNRPAETPPKGCTPDAPSKPTATQRDPRLPPPGAVLTREYKGRTYEVRVLERGFELDGREYRSLSKVAKVITGMAWNGFGFFFGKRGARSAQEASA